MQNLLDLRGNVNLLLLDGKGEAEVILHGNATTRIEQALPGNIPQYLG
jgi:hypothetical protein